MWLARHLSEEPAASPVMCADVEECGGGAGGKSKQMEEMVVGPAVSDLDFDFDIDFGDFFLRLDDDDGDALPDLEVDPAEIFITDFEAIATAAGDGGGGVMDQEVPSVLPLPDAAHIGAVVDPCCDCPGVVDLGEDNVVVTCEADVEEGKGECNNHADEGEEVVAGNNGGDSGEGGCGTVLSEKSPSSPTSQEVESRHKSSSKHSHGKKKAKVRYRLAC